MTIIDFGECEDSLRQLYNLTNNENIYIKMLEISQEDMRIPKVEYDVYSKLDGENITKLDINSCQNKKISLLIPVNGVDNLDKLNTKSDYYNNFCYITISDSGTDNCSRRYQLPSHCRGKPHKRRRGQEPCAEHGQAPDSSRCWASRWAVRTRCRR